MNECMYIYVCMYVKTMLSKEVCPKYVTLNDFLTTFMQTQDKKKKQEHTRKKNNRDECDDYVMIM